MKKSPKMYIVSGPNGAGKTTAFQNGMIPENIHFINADIIAKNIDPQMAESSTVAAAAGRIALEDMDDCIANGKSFVFETTLSGAGLLNKIRAAHEKGFEVELIFFWLPNAEAAIRRVRQRVSEGGHNIPEEVIRRRYERGLERLKNFYLPYIDRWSVYDNSIIPPYLAAKKDNNGIGVYSGYIKVAIDDVRERYSDTLDEKSVELLNRIEEAYKKMLLDKIAYDGMVFTADSEGNMVMERAADLLKRHYGKI